LTAAKASSAPRARSCRSSGWSASLSSASQRNSKRSTGPANPRRCPDSNALKLLQRIRDESHRVANSYNAQLRLKKISESLLDEFPGIGEARKAALLKKFGSIQRLRLATEEQIAEVPGFGGKAAAELKAFLLARTTEP
jgi:excinuclease UvrABC nuclease subunit